MSTAVRTQVVICCWAGDDPELVLLTLAAVVEQAGAGVVVVDMSPDGALGARAGALPGVVVEHRPGSTGLAESRQRGLELCDARFVAFLDADAVPRAGWLAALEGAITPPDVAVAGGPVLPVWPLRPPPALFRTATAGDFLSMLDLGAREVGTPRVLPGNMVIDRELTGEDVFQRGLGRNRGSLLGGEEIRMMVDAVDAGRRIVYTPGAVVDHRTTSDRMRWRWMWRRALAAGRESALHGLELVPLPRSLGLRDRVFLAAIAPAFLAGRLRAGRRERS